MERLIGRGRKIERIKIYNKHFSAFDLSAKRMMQSAMHYRRGRRRLGESLLQPDLETELVFAGIVCFIGFQTDMT
jgi:hypothetical protein